MFQTLMVRLMRERLQTLVVIVTGAVQVFARSTFSCSSGHRPSLYGLVCLMPNNTHMHTSTHTLKAQQQDCTEGLTPTRSPRFCTFTALVEHMC